MAVSHRFRAFFRTITRRVGVRRAITLFLLLGLLMSGQTMRDVENGTASLPGALFPVARAIFPACPTEDSDWCVWDAHRRGNGRGDSFLSLQGFGVTFR